MSPYEVVRTESKENTLSRRKFKHQHRILGQYFFKRVGTLIHTYVAVWWSTGFWFLLLLMLQRSLRDLLIEHLVVRQERALIEMMYVTLNQVSLWKSGNQQTALASLGCLALGSPSESAAFLLYERFRCSGRCSIQPFSEDSWISFFLYAATAEVKCSSTL